MFFFGGHEPRKPVFFFDQFSKKRSFTTPTHIYFLKLPLGIWSYKPCFALSLDILAWLFLLVTDVAAVAVIAAVVCCSLLMLAVGQFFHTLMCKHFLEVFQSIESFSHNKLKAFRCKHHPRMTYYTLNHPIFYNAPESFTDLCNINNQGPFLWWLKWSLLNAITWISLRWFFTDSTMVNHNFSPPFGRILFSYFSRHRGQANLRC